VTASESQRMCVKTSGCGSTNPPNVGSFSDASTRSILTANVKIMPTVLAPRKSCGYLGIETGLEGGERARDFPDIGRGAERAERPFRLAELPLPTRKVAAQPSEFRGREVDVRDVDPLSGADGPTMRFGEQRFDLCRGASSFRRQQHPRARQVRVALGTAASEAFS